MMWEIRNCVKCQEEKNTVPEDAEVLDFHIYSDVDKKWWAGDDCIGAQDFQNVLEKNPNAKNINLYINSYGGSVSEGVAIYNQLKRHKAYVTAYIDGFACSIASVIPMAADKVIMSDAGMMMIHNPWTFACGNSAAMRKCAEDLDKIRDGCIIPAYKNKLKGKISDEKLLELLDKAEMMTPKECLEYGFVDELTESDDNSKKEAQDKFNAFMNSAKEQFMKNFSEFSAKAFPEMPKAENKQPEPAPAEPEPKPEEKQDEPVPQPEPKPAENKTHEIFMKLVKGEKIND